MDTQGARRRGDTKVIAVVIVCVVSLTANVVRYASMVQTRQGHRTTATSARASAPGGELRLSTTCLREDNPATGAAIPGDDPFSHDMDDYGDGAELQRLYAVHDGTLEPHDGLTGVRPCDDELWSMVTAVATDRIEPYIDEVLIYDAALDSGGPDAFITFGEVSTDGTGAGHWRLAIAPNGASGPEVAELVAHEVAHLISLNSSQMAAHFGGSCGTLETGQGCLDSGGLLFRYLGVTWSDERWAEWKATDAITDEKAQQAAVDKSYDAHQSEFVTSYAATSPYEDFAESFGYWCAFGDDASDHVEGDPGDGQAKLDWFSQDADSQDFRSGCERLRDFAR